MWSLCPNQPCIYLFTVFPPTRRGSPQSRGGRWWREWRESSSLHTAQTPRSGACREPVCHCLATKGEGLGPGCRVLWCFCSRGPMAWLLDHLDWEWNLRYSHLKMGSSPRRDGQPGGDKDGEGPTGSSLTALASWGFRSCGCF